MESSTTLWRQPGFRRFWTASTVSDFGTPITTLAIQILVVVSRGLLASGLRRASMLLADGESIP